MKTIRLQVDNTSMHQYSYLYMPSKNVTGFVKAVLIHT